MKHLKLFEELHIDKIKKIRNVYNDLTKRISSSDSGVVGWMSKHNQEIRFVQLLKYVKKGDRILDYGCGVGDMFGYTKGKYNYTGIDINENMIKLAKEKYPDGNFNHMQTAFDFNKYDYDWFLASGVFSNYITEEEVIDILKPALDRAKKGLAVNFLTVKYAQADSGNDYLRGYKPNRLLRTFQEQISPNAELIRGYLSNSGDDSDFTIIFRK